MEHKEHRGHRGQACCPLCPQWFHFWFRLDRVSEISLALRTCPGRPSLSRASACFTHEQQSPQATNEAGHEGSVDDKVKAIENIDKEIISRIRSYKQGELSLMVMPDHPTPIKIKTHCPDPVPFLLWGDGFSPSKAAAFTEAEAKKSGVLADRGYTLMARFLKGD